MAADPGLHDPAQRRSDEAATGDDSAPSTTPPRALERQERRPLPSVLALQDLEEPARRLLPRSVFGFISGGAETSASVRANRAAYDEWAFRTRVLVDISRRRIDTSLFGARYTAPFGIAPMGGMAMACTDADLKLARAAHKGGIPFILSGASSIPLEQIRSEAPSAWFQTYMPVGRDAIGRLVDRAARAGYGVLVVTVDIPVPANRENNIRSGYSFPIRLSARVVRDALAHPRWLLATGLPGYIGNKPHLENFSAERGAALFRPAPGSSGARASALTWDDIAFIRGRWQGTLVIKGILSAEDARRARDEGAEGVIVSNHGGRQLDHSVATLRILPEVAAAAQGLVVMLDGGIRRGTDVLKALALGADFVFAARPFLYAVALGGEAGVGQAIDLLREEVDRDMALVGCAEPSGLDRSFLVPAFEPVGNPAAHT